MKLSNWHRPLDWLKSSWRLRFAKLIQREQEDRAQKYLDVAGVIFVALDRNGVVTFVNRKCCEILGRPTKHIIGKSWFGTFLPREIESAVKVVFHKLIAGELQPVEYFENPIVTVTGEQRLIAWHNALLRDEQGRIIGTLSSGEDITVRKRVEYELGQIKTRYQEIFDGIQEGIGIVDENETIVFANPAFASIFEEESPEALIGRSILDYLRDDQRAIVLEQTVKRSERQTSKYELDIVTRQGTCKTILVSVSPRLDADGRYVGSFGAVLDITERKRTEEALRLLTHRLSVATESAGIGVWDLDLKTNHLVWDDRMYQMYGVSASDFDGAYETWQKSVHPEDLHRASREVREAISGARDFHTSFRIVVPDGQVRHIEAHALVLCTPEGMPDRMVGVNLDITERIRVEQDLRVREALNRAIVENSPIGISIRSAKGELLSVNDAWMKIWGLSSEEVKQLIKEGTNDLTGGPKRRQLGKWFAQIEDICREGGVLRIPELYYDDDPPARSRWVSFTYYSIMNDHGEVKRVVILTEDITERKLAEEALRQSEEKYRSYIDNSPDGIFVFDTVGRLLEANPAVERMTGYTRAEILATTVEDFFPPEWRETGRQHFMALRNSGHHDGEVPIKRKDGANVWWATNIVRLNEDRFLGFAVDVTETRRLRELESRAQRLETAGRIAGQVAHDFNNLLAPLMAYPDFIREELPRNHPALAYLGSMDEATRRIAEINQQLLTLGRRGHYNQEPLNLNEVVQQILAETEYPRATLMCQTDLATDLMNVMAGRAQIYRVLLNLFQNARDAMGDIGRLTIGTENFHMDHAATVFCRVPEGEYVKLTLSDTGCGIPHEVMPKIFDPFFTTKITDGKRGSGLGLSVVDAVMKDHEGYVDVRSKVGEGTSVYLYFPVTHHACDEPERANVPGGSELVLVVDDDSVQRDVTLKLLSRLGYRAEAAASGEEALEKLRRQPVDLLVLDMVMPPGIDGVETYRRALEINSAQQAIIVSGFAESDRVSAVQELGAGAFVLKPLTRATLAQAVRRELDHNATEIVRT